MRGHKFFMQHYLRLVTPIPFIVLNCAGMKKVIATVGPRQGKVLLLCNPEADQGWWLACDGAEDFEDRWCGEIADSYVSAVDDR